MRVLKALSARACIPLCFIQVLKFESGQILPSDILFLQVLVVFTAVWISDICYIEQQQETKGFLSRIVAGTSFIIILFWVFFMTHYLFKKDVDERKYLLIDYGFPGLSFNQLFHWTIYEIWCLVLFIYNYFKAIGVGPVKLLSYLLYLGMHAVVVIFIMECIFTLLLTEVYFLLTDNFYYTFDENITSTYPAGYIDPLIMDANAYDKPTMKMETYSCPLGFSDRCFLTDLQIDDKNKKFPFDRKKVYRYIGEDVEMVCKFTVIKTNVVSAKLFDPAWFFREAKIRNDSRYSICNNYYQSEENVNVHSLLKIKYLKDSDFGEYVCSRPTTTFQYKLNKYGGIEEEFLITKPTINVFSLNQIRMKPRIIYRFVGNLIASEYFFLYNSEDDINDLSVVYTVNDKPLDEVCPGFQTQPCSLGASLLKFNIRFAADLFDWDGESNFPFIDIGEVRNTGLKRGIFYFCLCSSGYGIHRVVFIRKLHSGKGKRQKNEEILHPFVFIVLPQSTQSLLRLHDDTYLYANIEKLVQDDANFDVIENKVQDIIEFVKANEEKVFTMANVIQTVILICCVIFFYILTLTVSHWYGRLFIVYLPRRVFIPQLILLDAEPLLAIEQYEFDVFLSFSEEENNFVTEILVPFLEDNCHLRICVPNRDFAPNRSIFSSYVDNIQKSRKVIIVLSQSYIGDARCIYLQLEHIILPLLYEHVREQKDILIIRYDTVLVPELLRWNLLIKVFKWYEQLPLQVKLRKLKRMLI